MKLDDQQKEAVLTDSKSALVLAGAGSGKTRVLTGRIAHLMESGVSGFSIMAITFTRKAAGEIKKRVVDQVGVDGNSVIMGTMHGMALDYITNFYDRIGLNSNVTVYGQYEESVLLKEVAVDVGAHTGSTWRIKKYIIDQMFSDYYERGVIPEKSDVAYKLFIAFFARCRENNAMTYGQILHTFFNAIVKISDLVRIKHILVDEVQDIDPLQWAIINKMCVTWGASLFCVGDQDQSIYQWRGADPDYLIRRKDRFDIYRIESNYRNHPDIVEAANRLIVTNENRLEKTMVPKVLPEAKQAIFFVNNSDSEHLLRVVENNEIGPRAAILSRGHIMLKKLSERLSENDIKHEYSGATNDLVRSEGFRRFHAFLTLCVNPFDNFSFLLAKQKMAIPKETYKKIRLRSITGGKSHFSVWGEMPAEHGTIEHELKKQFFKYSQVGFRRGSLLPAAFGFAEALKSSFDSFELSLILNFIQDYRTKINGFASIYNYLKWVTLYDVQDGIDDETDDCLQLMTVHASKGLEFDQVILWGMNEGIFPHQKAAEAGEIEQERRLVYVGITRAENELILAIRPTHGEYKNGRKWQSLPSRFLGEMKP